jgi:hypothetical protein
MLTNGAWISTAWERHVRRLVELEVVLVELDTRLAAGLFRRFVAEFGDPARAPELERPGARPIDFERWLRHDCIRPARVEGSLRWLRGGHEGGRCVRFERRRTLPALEIDLSTMEDAWATSWPGAFVNFDRARALVVSVDYEAFRCDLRAGRATPYR